VGAGCKKNSQHRRGGGIRDCVVGSTGTRLKAEKGRWSLHEGGGKIFDSICLKKRTPGGNGEPVSKAKVEKPAIFIPSRKGSKRWGRRDRVGEGIGVLMHQRERGDAAHIVLELGIGAHQTEKDIREKRAVGLQRGGQRWGKIQEDV